MSCQWLISLWLVCLCVCVCVINASTNTYFFDPDTQTRGPPKKLLHTLDGFCLSRESGRVSPKCCNDSLRHLESLARALSSSSPRGWRNKCVICMCGCMPLEILLWAWPKVSLMRKRKGWTCTRRHASKQALLLACRPVQLKLYGATCCNNVC